MQNYSEELQKKYYNKSLGKIESSNEDIKVINLTQTERDLFKQYAQEVWNSYGNIYGNQDSQLLDYVKEIYLIFYNQIKAF